MKKYFSILLSSWVFFSFLSAQSVCPSAPNGWMDAPLMTTLPLYVGPPGVSYDPKINLRQGQHTLKITTNGAMLMLAIQLQIDGGVWQTLCQNCGTDHLITPSLSVGGHTIKIRVFDITGNSIEHVYETTVVPSASRILKDTIGNYLVIWQGGNVALDQPIIVSEGFDPKNNTNPAMEDYPEFFYKVAGGLFDNIRQQGADLVLINYNDGGISLLQNAEYLKGAIRCIDQLKTTSNPLKLIGISMGGIIGRYALASEEANGTPLNISHFASIDSPQQEAIISAPFQDFVKDKQGSNASVDINSVAAKQMLKYNAFDPTLHQPFYAQKSIAPMAMAIRTAPKILVLPSLPRILILPQGYG